MSIPRNEKVVIMNRLKLQEKNVTPTNKKLIITADSGYDGLKQVTVEAGNKEEQTKEVQLSMSAGDQGIMPDEGKVLKLVVVVRPPTLIPENIRAGVNIGGVIGTYTGE